MKLLTAVMIAFPYISIAQEIAMTSIVQTSQVQTPVQTVQTPVQTVQTPIAPRSMTEEVMELERRHEGISNVFIKGSVSINTKGKQTKLNASLFTTGDQTRVRIDYVSISIVDYILDRDQTSIYLPYKGVSFNGKKDDVIKLKSWFSLMTSDLCGLILAFPVAWDEKATQRRYLRDKNAMVIFSMNDDLVKIHKKVTFMRVEHGLVIDTVYRYDTDGELSGKITFNNYKMIMNRLVPHAIVFAVNDETTINFTFDEVYFDQATDGSIFKINIPQEVRKLDVMELEKRDWLSN